MHQDRGIECDDHFGLVPNIANRFVNCRVDFIVGNTLDPIGQLIQVILVPTEEPGALPRRLAHR